jgi:siroheme synthase
VLTPSYRATEARATETRSIETEDADWSRFASAESTLVVYMPGSNYAEIAGKLKAAGFAAETPCAIISRATTAEQQLHVATVADLHLSPPLSSPTLLVVGEVVRFADRDLAKNLHAPGQPVQASFALRLAENLWPSAEPWA